VPAASRAISLTPEIHADVVCPPGEPRIAYSQVGQGPDVVLVHGALVTRGDMVLALAERLRGRFRVTAFDRPGHGESGRLGPTGSPWRQAQALQAAAGSLGLRRPMLIGHSHGGAVALAWALQNPDDVAAVLALAPIVFPEARLEHAIFAPRGAPGVGPLINFGLRTAVDEALVPVLRRAMFSPQALPPEVSRTFPLDTPRSLALLEAEGEDAILLNVGLARSAMNYWRCRTPVRILAGDRDVVVNNAQHGQVLARLLPNGAFETLPGLGHMLHHFAQDRIGRSLEELCGESR
jgi:pimeloyl-ACP methyl ester carboxylesterase